MLLRSQECAQRALIPGAVCVIMPLVGCCRHCSEMAMDVKWLKNKTVWVYKLHKFMLVKAHLYGTDAEVRGAELAILHADDKRGPTCLV